MTKTIESIRLQHYKNVLTKYINIVHSDIIQKIENVLDIQIEETIILNVHYDTRVLMLVTKDEKKIVVKMWDEERTVRHQNELICLQLLQDNSIIPVPKLLYYDDKIIVMSYIEGKILAESEWTSDIKIELGNIFTALEKYTSSNYFMIDDEMDPEDDTIPSWVPNKSEVGILCHNDLHDENIIVENGHLVGIIDWELGGYYVKGYEDAKYDYLKEQYDIKIKISENGTELH